jgi:hypothetical protein
MENAENAGKFRCDECSFNCSKQSDYNRHISTRKHTKMVKGKHNTPYNYECDCGNIYKHPSGLSRHKTRCVQNVQPIPSEPLQSRQMVDVSIVIELLKQNKEFKDMMIEQHQQLLEYQQKSDQQLLEYQQKSDHRQEQLIEAVKDGKLGNTTNSNNTTNNKFNLNIFLNEQCKDAISLKDFVKNLEISMEDFVNTGELGFIEGLSQVMIKRINDMDIHDRPIHCTDLKRETVYIKDTHKWERDANKEQLRKAVKGVAYKNEQMRPKWYDETPDVDVLGSENCEKFFKYSTASLGGYGKEETRTFEDKIMRNVLKEVTIDKHLKIE